MNHLVRIIVAAGLAVLSCYVSAAGRTNARPDLPPEWAGIIKPKPLYRDTTRAEIFSSYYSAGLLLDVYKHLTADTTCISNSGPRESHFMGSSYSCSPGAAGPYFPFSVNEGGLSCLDNTNFSDIDNPRFPKRLGRELRRGNREYLRAYGKQMAAERRDLVFYLNELNAGTEDKPLVFIDIWRDYGGDIERYVNDLYDRSILTSHKRLNRFCRRPRVKTFASDPGVRFVISMELFRNDRKLKVLRAERGGGE